MKMDLIKARFTECILLKFRNNRRYQLITVREITKSSEGDCNAAQVVR